MDFYPPVTPRLALTTDGATLTISNAAGIPVALSSAAATFAAMVDGSPKVEAYVNGEFTTVTDAGEIVVGPEITVATIQAASMVKLSLTSNSLQTLTVLSAAKLRDISASSTGSPSSPFTTCSIAGAALTADAVDTIINFCVNNCFGNPGTLDISGGTSAAPSAASTANLATLATNGWSVIHN